MMRKEILLSLLLVLWFKPAFSQELVSPQQETLLPVKQGELWGYINLEGQQVIPFVYDKANPFNKQNVAKVEQDGKFMIISKSNKVLFVGAYKNFIHLSGNYYKYQCDTNWGVVKVGNKLKSECEYREPFMLSRNTTVFKVEKDQKFGLLDSNLQPILKCEFDAIWQDSGLVICELNNQYGAFDAKGNQLTRTVWDSIVPLSAHSLVGIDSTGAYLINGENALKKALEPGNYLRINQDFFAQQVGDKIRITRLENGQFESVKCQMVRPINYGKNHFIIFNGEYFGLYKYGQGIILDPSEKFEEVSQKNGVLLARQAGKFNIFDSKGKQLSKDGFDLCTNFEDGLVFAKNNQRWGIMKEEGELLLPYKFTAITILKDQIRARTDSGGMVLYEFQNGKITDELAFASIYKLNLSGFDNKTRTVSVPTANVNSRWFLRNRWGLRDSVGQELIAPLFQSFNRAELSPYVFVQVPRQARDRYPFRMSNKNSLTRQGLVNEQTGRIIAYPQYSMVDKEDVNNQNQDLVRVRSYAGNYGVVSKSKANGRTMWSTSYIGKFRDGIAPIYLRGYMTLKKPSENAEPIGTLREVLNDMGYSTGWGLFDKSKLRANDKVYLKGGTWNYLNDQGRLLLRKEMTFTQMNGDSSQIVNAKITHADVFRNGLAKVKIGDKWGLLDMSGNFKVEPKFEQLQVQTRADSVYYISFRHTPQYSCFTSTGRAVNERPVNDIDDFRDGVAWIKRGNKFGIMDEEGQVLETDEKFKAHGSFGSGVAPVKCGRSWSFIDKNLEFVENSTRFYKLGSFHDSRALAKAKRPGEKRPFYGFLNEDFEWVVPPTFVRVYDFQNGFARVRTKSGRYKFIDTAGNFISKKRFTRAKDFHHGLALVYQGAKAGVLDENGNMVIPLRQHRVFVQEGVVFTQKGRTLKVYNNVGKRIAKHKHTGRVYPMKNGLARVRQKGYLGYLNQKGEWQIAPRYMTATDFENGFALAGKGREKKIINLNGDTMCSRLFKTKLGFSNGFFVQHIKVQGGVKKFYYVNTSGYNQFGVYFEDAKPFENGKAVVRKGGYYGVIDTNGLFIVPPIFTSIAKTTEQLVVARNDFNYGLLDQNGNQVLAPIYESIRFIPEGLIMITKKEAPSYMDFRFNWVWRADNLSLSRN